MGLIERIRADHSAESRMPGSESRVIGGVPWRPWTSPFWRFSQGGPAHPTRSFYGVDEALGLPALYACTRLLADSLASLPIKIYSKASGKTVRWEGPSFFDHPSVSGSVYDWLFTAMTSLVLQGNAWGFITGRDGFGYPNGIEWIPPEDVQCEDDEQQPWNPLRTRIYVYGRQMDRDELFHIKAFSIPGRTEGISPLRAFALTVLSGIEAQRYGTDWYRAGGFPPGTFQNTEIEIDADQAEQIRAALTTSMRRREPLVYGRDWDYKPVTVPPSEAQFLEATQMNATQLAAVFGLPPDRVGGRRGDSLTYNTVEQSTLQVIEALRPWMVRLETAFFNVLPQNRYARFNSDALLKTDLKTRTDIYHLQRSIGLRTVDEMRELEDLEPLPGDAGNETIPLDVMVAMSRSIRAIPNSMLSQITLEMDLAAERLQEIQDNAPPPVPGQNGSGSGSSSGNGTNGQNPQDTIQSDVPTPASMLGQVLGQQRDGGDEVAEAARRVLAARKAGRQRGPAVDPEYIGTWLSPGELAAYASRNGNGNGNGRDHS